MRGRNTFLRRRAKRLLAPVLAVAVAGGGLALGAAPARANVLDVAYACAYYVNVAIGTTSSHKGSMGCPEQTSNEATSNSLSPSVRRTDAGPTPPPEDDEDGARANYGPATIFSSPYEPDDDLTNSGDLEVAIDDTGASVTATAKATGVGPSPFWTQTTASDGPWADPAKSDVEDDPGDPLYYDATTDGDGYVEATCRASSPADMTGSTTIKYGRVDTATGGTPGESDFGYPTHTVVVPENPPPNYRVDFTLDHIGDYGYIVFNEQIIGDDSTIIVNGMHMYMLGNLARGEMIIGQVHCGRVVPTT